MKTLTINQKPFMVKKNRVQIEKKQQTPVEYSTDPEEFKNDVEEKEAFLYTSKVNAAKNFSKHL